MQSLLNQYAAEYGVVMRITDNNANTLLSSSGTDSKKNEDLNIPLDNTGRIKKITRQPLKDYYYKYTEMIVDSKACGYILIIGANKNIIANISTSFKLTCELLLSGSPEMALFSNLNQRNTISNMLVSKLIDTPDSIDIQRLINQLELDTTMLYSVICVNYDFQINRYFNINLNLGYSESMRDTRKKLFRIIRHFKYFNTRDVVAEYNQNIIVILKALQSSSELSRAYKMLDVICKEINTELANFPLLRIYISHSNFYPDIYKTKENYNEAQMIIELGMQQQSSKKYYNANDLFMEILSQETPALLSKQCINPISDELAKTNKNIRNIVFACNTLIDCCFNQSKASDLLMIHRNTLNKRMDTWKELTRLDPENNFMDAIKSKLIIMDFRKRYPMLIQTEDPK